jgi:hypothetical protein
MKFEKFLKQTGTHGQIFTRENGDKWLVCGGVGMEIPVGAENFFGSNEVPEKVAKVINGLIHADVDDKVTLTRATVSADGKAKDIVRIFSDGLDIEVGIFNADFGLLEKSDYNLAEVEIEDSGDDFLNGKYLVILDAGDDVIGFIHGVSNI